MAQLSSRYQANDLLSVRVTREGHSPVEISLDQLTPIAVSRVFSLDPTTVWLKEEAPGNKAFFPDQTNSHFLLNDDVGYLITDFWVMGTPQSQPTSSARVISTTPGTGSVPFETSSAGPSGTQLQFTSSRGKNQSCNVKIVKASVKHLASGKIEFISQNQIFVDVTESTANVHYISSAVQRMWGQDYIIVTSDGLKLDDSSGTQGLKFWKVGSRKLFAIKNSDLTRKRSADTSSSSEDDPLPTVKRRRTAEFVKLSVISADIRGMQQSIDKIFSLTSSMTIPLGLKQLLVDNFRCSICQGTPMNPPIIFARCCKTILGCQQCVDTWYQGEEGQHKTCPNCRAERAFVDTCKVNGLDDFLIGVATILDGLDMQDD